MPADRRLKPNVWSMAGTGDNMKNLVSAGTGQRAERVGRAGAGGLHSHS